MQSQTQSTATLESAVTLLRWTVDEYHRLVSSGVLKGRRVELIQGDLIEMAPEGPQHSARTSAGSDYLRERVRRLASGRLVTVREAHPITLADSEPEPDIALVRGTHADYEAHHPYPDDIVLIIEISKSTLAYDLNEKKQTYAEAGIPEYWVLDVEGRELHVFQEPVQAPAQADQVIDYSEHKILKEGRLQLLKMPDVVVDVATFVG